MDTNTIYRINLLELKVVYLCLVQEQNPFVLQLALVSHVINIMFASNDLVKAINMKVQKTGENLVSWKGRNESISCASHSKSCLKLCPYSNVVSMVQRHVCWITKPHLQQNQWTRFLTHFSYLWKRSRQNKHHGFRREDMYTANNIDLGIPIYFHI